MYIILLTVAARHRAGASTKQRCRLRANDRDQEAQCVGPVDQRNVLDRGVFSYNASQDGNVLIFWYGTQIMIVKGREARKLLCRLAGREGKPAQLVPAKISAYLKHGIEHS